MDQNITIPTPNIELFNHKERQIMSLIAAGFCGKEIGLILHLKLREVEMHRYNIKLKLNTRTQKEFTTLIHHHYNGRCLLL